MDRNPYSMIYKVLIVDDSSFFQRRLNEIISAHPELSVVGTACNGREAIEKAASLLPDIITMDYEMPVLDGVSAVKEIVAKQDLPILMFSSLTSEGARITLDALEAGAVDFIAKDFSEISKNADKVKKILQDTILRTVKNHQRLRSYKKPADSKSENSKQHSVEKKIGTDLAASEYLTEAVSSQLKRTIKLLVIGASTGGPVALAELLKKLPKNFPLPILLVQHMPENFTQAFAERLNLSCHIEVRLAKDGDQLRPGLALLAPGGTQMMIDSVNRDVVRVIPGDDRTNYKPSVDITFASAAKVYSSKTLGIVLTGMGADGCEGARLLKQKGSVIWSQDKETSVIYGMPMAVAKERLTDCVMPLPMFGTKLAEIF